MVAFTIALDHNSNINRNLIKRFVHFFKIFLSKLKISKLNLFRGNKTFNINYFLIIYLKHLSIKIYVFEIVIHITTIVTMTTITTHCNLKKHPLNKIKIKKRVLPFHHPSVYVEEIPL